MEEPSDAGDEAPGEREVSRRDIVRAALAGSAGLCVPSFLDLNAARTMAQTLQTAQVPGRPMTFEDVAQRAEGSARQPYRPPADDLPPELAGLSYDGFQAIRVRPEATVPLGSRFSLQPFHRGGLHARRVEIFFQAPG